MPIFAQAVDDGPDPSDHLDVANSIDLDIVKEK